jgi:hypothetical protein
MANRRDLHDIEQVVPAPLTPISPTATKSKVAVFEGALRRDESLGRVFHQLRFSEHTLKLTAHETMLVHLDEKSCQMTS